MRGHIPFGVHDPSKQRSPPGCPQLVRLAIRQSRWPKGSLRQPFIPKRCLRRRPRVMQPEEVSKRVHLPLMAWNGKARKFIGNIWAGRRCGQQCSQTQPKQSANNFLHGVRRNVLLPEVYPANTRNPLCAYCYRIAFSCGWLNSWIVSRVTPKCIPADWCFRVSRWTRLRPAAPEPKDIPRPISTWTLWRNPVW